MIDYLTDNNNEFILDSNSSQIETANIVIYYINSTISNKADIYNDLLRYRLINTNIDSKYELNTFAYRNIYTSWYLTSIEGFITDNNGDNVEVVELEPINIDKQLDIKPNRYKYLGTTISIEYDISNEILRWRYLDNEITYKMNLDVMLNRLREVNTSVNIKVGIESLLRKKIAIADVIYTKYKEN